MPRFVAQVDFSKIPVHEFAVEGSATPPESPVVGQQWVDTSMVDNAIAKYWDGNEWVRMDGGGDIPNGMVEDRHISETAAIQWSKIDAPDDLATTGQIDALTGGLGAVEARVTTAEADIDALEVDVADHETRLSTVEASVQDVNNATQAELDALDGRVTTAEGEIDALQSADTALSGRLDAVETATQDINNATQAELDALDGRVTTAEGEIDTLQSEMDSAEGRLDTIQGTGAGSITAAVQTETDRATAAEAGLDDRIDDEVAARTAADTALDSRVTALEGVDNFTQAEADAEQTRVNDALALKADLVNGLVPKDQLPSIALSTVTVVADETERDALTGQDEGDIAVLTGGGGGSFIWDNDAGGENVGGWVALSMGADAATDAELNAAMTTLRAEFEAADDALDTRISALEAVDYATQAELDAAVATINATTNDLDSRITTEVADRTAADNLIRTDFAAADAALQTAIENEEARATAAEGTLQDNINAEATTRQTADTALQGEIDAVEDDLAAETLARTTADTALDGRLTTAEGEIDALQSGLTTAEGDIDSLETRMTTAEGEIDTLQTDLAAETSARTSADSALSGRLDTLEGDDTVVGSVANSVKVERDARIAADTALQTNIDAEATNRAAADTALQGNINAEATARQSADAALQAEIDAAETAISDEATARAAADNALQGEIDALEADVATRALDADVVHKDGAENITGVKTFATGATPVITDAPVNGTDAANKAYVDSQISTNAYDDTALEARVTAVEGEVDVLNSDENTAGSVANTADARIAAQKGQADGLATLGNDGKVPSTQLPALALTNVTVYADITARDAATGMDEGDVAIVTDIDGDGTRGTFIWDDDANGGLGAWVPLSSPADVTEAELAAAVDAAIATEVSAREAADAALSDRIDNLGAGAGLTRTGDTLDVVGTADRIVASADSIDIASTYAGQASIDTLGTVTTGTWNADVVALGYGGTGYAATDLADLKEYLGIPTTVVAAYSESLTSMVEGTPTTVTHNLGTLDVVISVRNETTGAVVFADVVVVDANSITVTTDASYSEESLRVTIHGVGAALESESSPY